jgi:linoleate 10R-lipoxygenase
MSLARGCSRSLSPFVSTFPAFGEFITQRFRLVYKDLPHPPASYLALPSPSSHLLGNAIQTGDAKRLQPVTYAYRSADGSYYNPLIPSLGMAGSPYARSVPSQRCLPRAALPPSDLVFDALLKRDKFVEHPGGICSLFFAFADIIIHNIFNTDQSNPSVRDWTTNAASSYLDLSPLYGSSQEAVNSVRKHDGTGKLHEDVFADPRLLNMPPAVCALLVIFNRNHNVSLHILHCAPASSSLKYVAEKILSINENGNFKNPPPTGPSRATQDEEIFQRARLVNAAYFVQVILRDYVGAILGLARDGSSWRLDPLMVNREDDFYNHLADIYVIEHT